MGKNYLYDAGFGGGGICIGDVNGDGLVDLYATDGAGGVALYLNKGGFKFVKSGSVQGW